MYNPVEVTKAKKGEVFATNYSSKCFALSVLYLTHKFYTYAYYFKCL